MVAGPQFFVMLWLRCFVIAVLNVEDEQSWNHCDHAGDHDEDTLVVEIVNVPVLVMVMAMGVIDLVMGVVELHLQKCYRDILSNNSKGNICITNSCMDEMELKCLTFIPKNKSDLESLHMGPYKRRTGPQEIDSPFEVCFKGEGLL